jgi:hypothetical protein
LGKRFHSKRIATDRKARQPNKENRNQTKIGGLKGGSVISGERKQKNNLPGFVTMTKHNPPEEEQEDQIDTWNLKINPAEPKTVPTDAQIPGAKIDTHVEGDETGTNRGVRVTFESRPSRGILQ